MKKKPVQKPVKKSRASVNSKLAKGAEEIRKAKAKKEPAKKAEIVTTPEPLAINEIIASRVTMGPHNASLSLSPETTQDEYLRIFDELVGTGERVQFLIGDVVNEGEKLACFGEKYAVAMAETGRSLSTLKSYASAARHIPPDLRVLPYTHMREIVKVPALEDKQAIIAEAEKAIEAGSPLTVKEIRKRADAVTPRKPKKKEKPGKETRSAYYVEITQIGEAVRQAKALMDTLTELGGTGGLSEADKLLLRAAFEPIAAFYRTL